MDAAYAGNAGIIPLLLNAGADIDAIHIGPGGAGETALMIAVRKSYRRGHRSHEEVVASLVAVGANLEVDDFFGLTALMKASSQGNVRLAALLLEAGADIDAKGNGFPSLQGMANYGGTALMIAVGDEEEELVDYLIAQGADVNAANDDGMTALDIAIGRELTEIATLLLDAGAERGTRGGARSVPDR